MRYFFVLYLIENETKEQNVLECPFCIEVYLTPMVNEFGLAHRRYMMRETTENALQVLEELRIGFHKHKDPEFEGIAEYFHKELQRLEELMAYVQRAIKETTDFGIIQSDTRVKLIELSHNKVSRRDSLYQLLYLKSGN